MTAETEGRDMIEKECPLCGRGMKEESTSDRDGATTIFSCKQCRLWVAIPSDRRDDYMRAVRSMRPMTVQSVQRQEVPGEDGNPVRTAQAIVTTDGPVLEALVDLEKVGEMCGERSPLGFLEDALLLGFAPKAHDARP